MAATPTETDMAGKLSNIRIKELPEIRLGGGIDLDLDNLRIKELAPSAWV